MAITNAEGGVCAGTVSESCTCTVNVEVLTSTGVPVTWPDAGFSVSPEGSWPLATFHVYGGTPPETMIPAEYGCAVCPLGSEIVVIWSGGGSEIVIDNGPFEVWF